MTQEQIVQLVFIILPFLLAVGSFVFTKYLLPKLPANQQTYAMQLVMKAVQAAEQKASSATVGMTSDEKKALAEQFVQSALKSAGLSISPTVIDMLIESAVFMLNQSQSVFLPPQTFQSANTASQTSASPVGSTAASTSPAVPPVIK